jgi:hypothetical protein
MPCVEYVEKTGDSAVLATPVGYLNAPPLVDDELERYEQPRLSALTERSCSTPSAPSIS